MKKRTLTLAIVILFVVTFMITTFVISKTDDYYHSDSNLYSKDEVKEHCDFDLSQTKWKIDTLNSGKIALVHKKLNYVAKSKNGDVFGTDTCYIKMRAFFFWEREIKQK